MIDNKKVEILKYLPKVKLGFRTTETSITSMDEVSHSEKVAAQSTVKKT